MLNLNFKTMRKINFLVLIAFIASVGFIATSCSKGEAPVVTTAGSDTVVNVGDSIAIVVSVSGDNKLTDVAITGTDGASVKFDGVSDKTFTGTKSFLASTAGTVTYTITATDKKDQITSATVAVTVKAGVTSYTAVLLNNNWSTTQSGFYSVTNNKVYQSLSEAKTNATNVDFIHVLRAQAKGGRIIAAPIDTNANQYNADLTNADRIGQWTVRNTTNFKKVTVTDWSTVAKKDITTLVTGLTATAATSLVKDDVYAFQTQSGKKGLFKVTSVSGSDYYQSGGNNVGSITIEVKISE